MPDPNRALTIQLLAWVEKCPRTYVESIDAWRTSCPRHTIWDDALREGLIEVSEGNVTITHKGSMLLRD